MPIYLIRHGQSEFNAAHKDGEKDPLIFDAPLTDKGRRQAADIRAIVAALNIRHVITSPLTRAIQTAAIVFEDTAPISVAAGPHEQLVHSCDVGRQPDDLREDFPSLFFDHLQDNWWHQGPKNEDGVPVEPEETFLRRISAFSGSLAEIKTRPVAIVGHGNAFKALTGQMMDNCEIVRFQPDNTNLVTGS
jgi:broad specificity phosphatase PhoE